MAAMMITDEANIISDEEKDENPELACTSQLQKWHKKGGGQNIFPQPVMEVVVKKTKLDESSSPRGGAGVKCLLYEHTNILTMILYVKTLLNLNFLHLTPIWNFKC